MEKLQIALIGLGGRGTWWLGELLAMEDVEVTAVCDKLADRMENGRRLCREKYGREVFGSTDYREIVSRPDNRAVIVTTSWNDHVRISVAAMRAGKYAASEVGPAQSLQQCWELVRAREESGMPFMLLENCCYGREEMTVLNMVKKGLFGEVVHCAGGYRHDLREHLVSGYEQGHDRCWHNMHRRGELYPTHELGPIMTWLNVNRGNRMLTLTASASKGRGLGAYMAAREQQPRAYLQGDVTITTIHCANGETILLTHDVCLPHPYSRMGLLEGTKGIWLEDKHSVYLDGTSPEEQWEDIAQYYEKYEHPLWKKTGAADFTGGHGGMDWLVMRAFLNAVRCGTDTPIDVYDAAAMMAVAVLSEESIAMGSAPVAIPDFTDGKWVRREPGAKSVFSLEEVDDELYREEVRI